ncbi:M24 family metallopeptidase [Isachenkonia alkalipeptolytica]|uniref:Aminopeptidase P family protein n=1 Tax=Isachenkonia alkalipeptolytica TaxID=2565777 RepID=A0AA43XM00_9CLOT|nr:Xaa-Pro peptidase family protein [Isachenkonia alkalipeptolytica]NBG88789.1 aminopeptidase P family protein [Isachenkonia alkalipeptolytica]
MTEVNSIRKILKEKELDGILIFNPENRQYVSGFTGSAGYVLISEKEQIFMTDFRYIEQAKKQTEGFEILEISRDNPVTDIINGYKFKNLGIEDDFLTYEQYLNFNEKLEATELVPLKRALIELRSVKTNEEIYKIQEAAKITDNAYEHIIKKIQPGMREIEVALDLEYFMKTQGASKVSFDIIVASGHRSALPHGVASEKTLEKGDMVTIDFGCVYQGYCSDMTRSFVLGQATEKQKEVYHTVLEAQNTALAAVKPGKTGKELDEIARSIITNKGYGKYFGHGLGHGVGLEVHELPHVNHLGEKAMEAGMVITIEPGVYIPDFGGVRIEDLLAVTEDGYKVLSNTPKELIEIPC